MSSVSQLVKHTNYDGAAPMALSQCRLYGIGCKPDRRAAFNAVRLAAQQRATVRSPMEHPKRA